MTQTNEENKKPEEEIETAVLSDESLRNLWD